MRPLQFQSRGRGWGLYFRDAFGSARPPRVLLQCAVEELNCFPRSVLRPRRGEEVQKPPRVELYLVPYA